MRVPCLVLFEWFYNTIFCLVLFEWFYNTILKRAGLIKFNTAEERENREWSDLPPELVSLIAERAGLFELVSFFRVCKAWYSASSTALAHIVEHELNQGPLFLLYEEKNSECRLLTGSGKKFTTSLPELEGTTCLATYHGWLLLFKPGGSMFFFHVFSRQRIDLPDFPVSKLNDHVAAVSSPPTSQDCVLCILSRSNDETMDARVLCLRDQTWTRSQYSHPRGLPDKIKYAYYHKGKFYFSVDELNTNNFGRKTIVIGNQSHHWKFERLSVVTSENRHRISKSSIILSSHNELKKNWKDMKNKLGLGEDVSVSTCGTITPLKDGSNKAICNESVKDNNEESMNRCFKGVWIQPRSSIKNDI